MRAEVETIRIEGNQLADLYARQGILRGRTSRYASERECADCQGGDRGIEAGRARRSEAV
jgi:hypothetical protein